MINFAAQETKMLHEVSQLTQGQKVEWTKNGSQKEDIYILQSALLKENTMPD